VIRRSIDLVAVALANAALLLVVALMPPSLARTALTAPFVLFLPGYTLSVALFPRRGDADLVERIALSLGLSFTVVPMLGLALHYLPWGIHLVPILVSLTLLIAAAAGIGMYRRTLAPPGEEFGAGLRSELSRRWSSVTMGERLFAVAFVLTAVMVGIGTVVAVERRDPADPLRFDEMVAYLTKRGLMRQKLPERLELVDAVPRNPTGKILKHELRRRFAGT